MYEEKKCTKDSTSPSYQDPRCYFETPKGPASPRQAGQFYQAAFLIVFMSILDHCTFGFILRNLLSFISPHACSIQILATRSLTSAIITRLNNHADVFWLHNIACFNWAITMQSSPCLSSWILSTTTTSKPNSMLPQTTHGSPGRELACSDFSGTHK